MYSCERLSIDPAIDLPVIAREIIKVSDMLYELIEDYVEFSEASGLAVDQTVMEFFRDVPDVIIRHADGQGPTHMGGSMIHGGFNFTEGSVKKFHYGHEGITYTYENGDEVFEAHAIRERD